MTQAIDVLMGEHRVIEKVLAALEAHAAELAAGRSFERPPIGRFADFFRNYADACHHGKEEELLFKRMNDFGFPAEEGPIGVMLYEHALGRQHVAVLRQIGEAAGGVTASEQGAFAEHVGDYVPMLRSHIYKEDNILYPMALQVLPPQELDRLAQQYEEFQAKVVGPAAYAEMERLADELAAAHPFDPEVLRAQPATGCGARR